MGNSNNKVAPADEDNNNDNKNEEKSPGGTPLKYDPNFKGPIKNRSCTDVICCLLFIIFIAGLGVVSYFAFKYGNPSLLLYPVDSDGNLCGRGTNVGKNNLFFFDIIQCGRMGVGVFIKGCPTPQICVSKCPDSYYTFVQAMNDPKQMEYCKSSVDLATTSLTTTELVQKDYCPSYTMESEPVINRCVPKPLVDFLNGKGALMDLINNQISTNMVDKNNDSYSNDVIQTGLDAYGTFLKAKEYAEKMVQDVVVCWWMILCILLMTMIFSFIWIVIMRFIAGIMVWITICAFLALFGFLTYWSIWSYIDLKDSNQEFTISFVGLVLNISKPKMYLAFGIIAGVIFTISLLILLFLCSRIRIAIQLIKEGSKAIGTMMFSLLFPLVPFLLQIVVVVYWLVVAVFLASTGRNQSFDYTNNSDYMYPNGTYKIDKIKTATSQFFGEACDNGDNSSDSSSDFCTFIKNQEEQFTLYAQIFNLFMFFWLLNFVIALGQMTLAGSFASYYWAFEKPKDLPTFPVSGALWRCFRYHLGSLAFGSLIIAIVQMIRVALEYIDAKLKGKENPVAKFFVKCLKCCFWCLEKVVKFLTKNAYIMIAAHGKNFCISAKDAFFLLLRNAVRAVVLDKVTDFLMFVCKMVVVGASVAGSYFFFNGSIDFLSSYTPQLNFFIVPIIIVAIGAYLIATCFFAVYEMGVDTLFLCFLEDLERNDGSQEKPYFMSKDLMSIVGKKNEIMKQHKKNNIGPSDEF